MMKSFLYYTKESVSFLAYWLMLHFFWLCPIKKNKIVATAARGRKYADNPRFIVEELLERNLGLDIVWLKLRDAKFQVPQGIRLVLNNKNFFRLPYEYATAHVIIESAHFPLWLKKRKGQIVIQTWHGGLGVKKIEYDANNYNVSKIYALEIGNTVDIADVFISNSAHLSKIYRRAFKYSGPIYNCGYPKNDVLFSSKDEFRKRIRERLGLRDDVSIVTYAPTFREYFFHYGSWNIDMSVYDLDYERLARAFESKFCSKCVVLVKMHPNNQGYVDLSKVLNDHVFDVTDYNNMQEIILASDYFISDYSSCIFDAAMTGIPCFTFATDFDKYKSDERGVYYEMDELPFPYASNNDELEHNILHFNEIEYHNKWLSFSKEVELNETGHATKDIVDKIGDILAGKQVNWNNSSI